MSELHTKYRAVKIISANDIVINDVDYICSAVRSELRMMEGQTLLITGGAGFLGYYLINSILHYNHHYINNDKIKLIVYDNFIRGIPIWLEEINDECFRSKKQDISLTHYDVIDHCDYIIHAASIASPTYYRLYPIETMDSNVNGLRNILNYTTHKQKHTSPIKGILYFSSSEIYGSPDEDHIPTDESYFGNVSCTGPRACYDESKRYGETLCVNFARKFDIPVKIVRPFNNYGPGLKINDGRVISDFANNILKNQNIILLSNGNSTRTFCYVADAIIGYFKVLIKGNRGEAYNIGVEHPEISVTDLAHVMSDIAKELWEYSGSIEYGRSSDNDYLTHNPERRCPDISKARKELDYHPEIPLRKGLQQSLIWYRENLHANTL